jgi:hypothetical protein
MLTVSRIEIRRLLGSRHCDLRLLQYHPLHSWFFEVSGAVMAKTWKKGRGKLGFLQPLIGKWVASAESPMGPLQCTRSFTPFGESYVRLDARWVFSPGGKLSHEQTAMAAKYAGKPYEEIALIGVGDDGKVGFWSFTSDGKRSQGTVADVSDIHAEAVGFEAQMPAGLARMAYWPDDDGGFFWVVESKNKSGWNRFTEHHYRPA